MIYMTSGENGVFPGIAPTPQQCEDLKVKRQAEAREACRILGVRNVTFLPGKDGSLSAQPQLAEDILCALGASDYRSVFCPWPFDGHPDHVATYQLFHNALHRYVVELEVYLYEVWSPMPANLVLSIDATFASKLEAFSAHASQAALLRYKEGFEGLARYRSLFCPPV